MSSPPAKFELGDVVYFHHEQGRQFTIVGRDWRPYSGNWHYLLRGDKWRIEADLSPVKPEGGQYEGESIARSVDA